MSLGFTPINSSKHLDKLFSIKIQAPAKSLNNKFQKIYNPNIYN